jgi:DNA-directed RNA polymerase specialized sigma24 family protein
MPYDELDRRFLVIRNTAQFRAIVDTLARRIRRAVPGTAPMDYAIAAIQTRKNLEQITEAGERENWGMVACILRRKVITRLRKDRPMVPASVRVDELDASSPVPSSASSASSPSSRLGRGKPALVPRYQPLDGEPTTLLAAEATTEQQQLLRLGLVDLLNLLFRFRVVHPSDATLILMLYALEIPRSSVANMLGLNDNAFRQRLRNARLRFAEFLRTRGHMLSRQM